MRRASPCISPSSSRSLSSSSDQKQKQSGVIVKRAKTQACLQSCSAFRCWPNLRKWPMPHSHTSLSDRKRKKKKKHESMGVARGSRKRKLIRGRRARGRIGCVLSRNPVRGWCPLPVPGPLGRLVFRLWSGIPKQPAGPLNQLGRKSASWIPPWPSATCNGVLHCVGTKPGVQLWLRGLTSAQPV